MKAAVIHEHGELDKVRVEDVPKPSPGVGEVLVQVRAASLNHLDIWVRKGGRFSLPMPHVLGSDAAGLIVELGHGVQGVELGQEVTINPALYCGHCEFCRQGQQSLCADFSIVGASRPGTYAEFVTVPADNVLPKPAGMSFEQASTLGVAYVTAWRMLFTRAKVQPGDTVLIHGIGGGVATAGLQLAKLGGARVIVTSSSAEKLEHARRLGADDAIDYSRQDVVAAVRDYTAGRGVDIAFDAVGAATWQLDFDCLRRGGTIVLCGVTTGQQATTNLQQLYWNQLTVLGSTSGSLEDFRRMTAAMEHDHLEPVIDSVLPLDQAVDAMRRMEEARQLGKIVLKVS